MNAYIVRLEAELKHAKKSFTEFQKLTEVQYCLQQNQEPNMMSPTQASFSEKTNKMMFQSQVLTKQKMGNFNSKAHQTQDNLRGRKNIVFSDMSGEEGDPTSLLFMQRAPENVLEQTDFIDEEDLDEQVPVQEVDEVILNLISVGKFIAQFNSINSWTKKCFSTKDWKGIKL